MPQNTSTMDWQAICCACCLRDDQPFPSSSGQGQRRPFQFTKMIPLNTRRPSTRDLSWLFGKKGRRRSICSSVSLYKSLTFNLIKESQNHILPPISIGPEPNIYTHMTRNGTNFSMQSATAQMMSANTDAESSIGAQ